MKTPQFFILSGSSLCGILILIALFGPFFIQSTDLQSNLDIILAPPSSHYLLGRTETGADVLAWVLVGARVSLLVAVLATFFSLLIGFFYGCLAGFIGGKTDAFLMRIVDILLAFPGILLALYVSSLLKPSLINLIGVLSVTGWTGYARLVRAQVLQVKERDFVLASTMLGASNYAIIFRHVLPNIIGPVVVQVSFGLSGMVLAEASLSFLGFGVPLGTPSWGALLDQGVAHLFDAPHLALSAGACIALSVLSFNLLGDGLRDVFDSKSG